MSQLEPRRPDGYQLLSIWTRIGLQSFGGGQAVQLLAYEALVDHQGWLQPEDWAEAWGVCQVVPGVNVIAVAALTGSRLAGWQGVGASVGGLMLPSVVITLFMTAGLATVRDLQWVKAALHGIVFAAAGGSFMVGYRLVRPLLAAARDADAWARAVGVAIVAVAAVLAWWGRIPLFAVLVGAGALSAVVATVAREGPGEIPV